MRQSFLPRGATFVIALCVLLMNSAGRALANTITTFHLTGTFSSGATLAGTVTFDTTTGVATAANLLYTGQTLTGVVNAAPVFGVTPVLVYDPVHIGSVIYLLFPGSTLVGYTGGSLCGATNHLCPDPSVAGSFFASYYVNLVPPPPFVDELLDVTAGPVVPEPASLLLMMTGALGAAGALRHRLTA